MEIKGDIGDVRRVVGENVTGVGVTQNLFLAPLVYKRHTAELSEPGDCC